MTLATPHQAALEYVRNVGRERPDEEWILTDYDSWHKNPFYTGKPGRHPEDDMDEEEYALRAEREADAGQLLDALGPDTSKPLVIEIDWGPDDTF